MRTRLNYFLQMDYLILPFIFLFLFGAVGLVYVFQSWQSHRSPGSPYSYQDCVENRVPNNGKKVVVLGDSLTHGTMSHNWLNDLQAKYLGEYVFINQGWNGDLAWNALQKVDQVIECEPDIIAIFIGGNDALASFNQEWSDNFVRDKGLPETPSAEWYAQNLEQIIVSLQTETEAELILFGLTLFGEDTESEENGLFATHNQVVHDLGEQFALTVLPVHEGFKRYLNTHQAQKTGVQSCSPPDWNGYKKQIKWALVNYHFLFQSWDKISARRGYQLQTDCVHLNSTAAGIITDLFSEWLNNR